MASDPPALGENVHFLTCRSSPMLCSTTCLRSWGILGHGVLRLLLDPCRAACCPCRAACRPWPGPWACRAAWAGSGQEGLAGGHSRLDLRIRVLCGSCHPQPWALASPRGSPSARWAEGGHHSRSSSWSAGAPDSLSPISLPEPSMQPLFLLPACPTVHLSIRALPRAWSPCTWLCLCSLTLPLHPHIPIAWPVFSGLFLVSSHVVCGLRLCACVMLGHTYVLESWPTPRGWRPHF